MTKTLCIIGGTGFIGSHLAVHLADAGWRVRLPSRRPQRRKALRVHPGIELIGADVHDRGTLAGLFRDCRAVINLAGILNEQARGEFERVHVELPRRILEAMRATGVGRLLHMSALNADPTERDCQYLRTKGEGERLVMEAHDLAPVCFRPSVVFGPGDSFFNRFAGLLRLSPLVFPLACPDARFAPVYVGDLVAAMDRVLRDDGLRDRCYELCGPAQYSLRELVEFTARQLGLRRRVIGLPDWMARLQARVLGLLPGRPFTLDNYYALQKDSLCTRPALAEFGITPHSIECLVPSYLGGGRLAHYQRYRRRARRAS